MTDSAVDQAKQAAAEAARLQAEADVAIARAQAAAAAAAQAASAAAAPMHPPAAASAGASGGPLTTDQVDAVRKGYAFTSTALELGALLNGDPVPDVPVRVPLAMLNRHGLVAGATGTGKTRTLQALAEHLSANGVPVFAADMKGDLSGIATAGTANPKLAARTATIGQDWQAASFPVEFYSLGGAGRGVPIRATVHGFGPLLLSRALGLNETQASSLALVFHYAEDAGLALLDLADLRAVLQFLASDEGKEALSGLGGISGATIGVILRELVGFADGGADAFFGEPEIDTAEFLRTAADGRGIVSLLELPSVADRPQLYSTFLMWLLADLFNDLPEIGDADKPKLVFFFDEAHLLFTDASKDFLAQITRTVRLIRSKGVGIFFITQTPKDVPGEVLSQLGSRVQHALRAFTPDDAKALRATVSTYPRSGYDLEEVLTTLGIGEAVVTVMSETGAPTPVAWTRLRAPQAAMGPSSDATIDGIVEASPLQAKYGTALDRESAAELLTAKMNAAKAAADGAAAQKSDAAAAKQQATADAAARRQQAAADRDAAQAVREREREAAAHQRQLQHGAQTIGKVLGSRATQQVLSGVLEGIFGTRRRR